MDDVFAIKSAKKTKDAKKQKKERGYKAFDEDEPIQSTAKERIGVPDELLSPTSKQPKPMKTIKSKVERFIPTAKKEKEKEKDKEKEKKTLETTQSGGATQAGAQFEIFGLDLEVVNQLSVSHDGVELPVFFRQCIDYLEECGLECDGIYRVSGLKSKVNSLKMAFANATARGEVLERATLDEAGAYVIASFVKAFVHELPEPILGNALTPRFDEAACIRDVGAQIRAFRALLDSVRRSNYLLLATMIIHLEHVIAHQAENRMTQQNVSIVFAPSMRLSHRVLNVLFSYTRELFAGVTIQRYVPPIRVRILVGEADADGHSQPPTVSVTAELPDRLADLDDELRKQESLLEHLHRQLARATQPDRRSLLEAELWEVPKLITKLKRKRTLLLLETPEAIEVEMRKQEALLNKLHGELTTSRSGEARAAAKSADTDKQEELWDVQRTITMLKRRLKLARKGELHVHAASGLVEPLAVPVATGPPGSLTLTAAELLDDEDDVELNLELAKPVEDVLEQPAADLQQAPEIEGPMAAISVEDQAEPAQDDPIPPEPVATGSNFDDRQGDANESAECAAIDAELPEMACGTASAEIENEADIQHMRQSPQHVEQEDRHSDADNVTDTELQQEQDNFAKFDSAHDEQADSGESASESAASANHENEDSQSRSDLHLTLAIEAQSAEELQTLIVDEDAAAHSLAAPRSSESVNIAEHQCDSELLNEYYRLRFTNSELRLIGDELRQKIGQERREIERLRNEIVATEARGTERTDPFGDIESQNTSTVCQLQPERVWHEAAAKQEIDRQRTASSSSSTSASSNEPFGALATANDEDPAALRATFTELRGDCERVRRDNAKLVDAIQTEKRRCADIKVEIHLLQRSSAQSHPNQRTPL